MRYRIIYEGSGQVSLSVHVTKKAAQKERATLIREGVTYAHLARIQFEDPDTNEWFYCGVTNETDEKSKP